MVRVSSLKKTKLSQKHSVCTGKESNIPKLFGFDYAKEL